MEPQRENTLKKVIITRGFGQRSYTYKKKKRTGKHVLALKTNCIKGNHKHMKEKLIHSNYMWGQNWKKESPE